MTDDVIIIGRCEGFLQRRCYCYPVDYYLVVILLGDTAGVLHDVYHPLP